MPLPAAGPALQCHSVVGVHTTEDISEAVLYGGQTSDLDDVAGTKVYTFGK